VFSLYCQVIFISVLFYSKFKFFFTKKEVD